MIELLNSFQKLFFHQQSADPLKVPPGPPEPPLLRHWAHQSPLVTRLGPGQLNDESVLEIVHEICD